MRQPSRYALRLARGLLSKLRGGDSGELFEATGKVKLGYETALDGDLFVGERTVLLHEVASAGDGLAGSPTGTQLGGTRRGRN